MDDDGGGCGGHFYLLSASRANIPLHPLLPDVGLTKQLSACERAVL